MERKLYQLEQVKEMITAGRLLLLSADENMLKQLPKGNWVGGTIPYFMDVSGGRFTSEEIFVDDFTDICDGFCFSKYNCDNINNIGNDSYDNGFSVVVIPAGCKLHSEFSHNTLNYENIFRNPLIGFVAGVDLNNLATQKPKTFFGIDLSVSDSEAVVIHAKLQGSKVARVEIVNIFEQDDKSDVLTFVKDGFIQKECFVNGVKENFAEYLKRIGHDIKFPIIENQAGAMINKSFQKVDYQTGEVTFYAPLFSDSNYKFAKPVEDYVARFNILLDQSLDPVYSCNCILNYLYGGLEGKKTSLTGATTFGEIAYQLLNQTLLYMIIEG